MITSVAVVVMSVFLLLERLREKRGIERDLLGEFAEYQTSCSNDDCGFEETHCEFFFFERKKKVIEICLDRFVDV
jgi:hypothetical protein